VRQSIRGFTDGVIEQTQPGLDRVAVELGAVRDVVAGSDDLRQALVDSGLAVASRRAILTDLLAGKVSEPTLRLLTFVVDYDRATEVADDIDWLAARVDAAVRNLVPMAETTLGRRAAEERLDGYATAVLAGLTSERDLVTVEDDLFRFLRMLQGSEALLLALSSRDTPTEARRRIVVDLLDRRIHPASVRLAAYATRVGRPRDYEDLLAFLVDRVAAENHRRVAEVRSVTDLDEGQQQRLTETLVRLIGRDVDVRVTVDKSILGGFIATIGDTVVDGSARRKFELLKERLEVPEAALTFGSSGPIATTGEPTDG
jgi:F-type H+-transporting ATPase subunit delta